MHRGVQLRVVQVFGSHLLGSAITHGRSVGMDRSGNGADIRIARRDRPVNRVALADRKRRRNVFPADGNPVFNGGIAVIRHLTELGIDITHRSVRELYAVPVMIRCSHAVFVKCRYRQCRSGGYRPEHGRAGIRFVAARERPDPVVFRHVHGQVRRVVLTLGYVAFLISTGSRPFDILYMGAISCIDSDKFAPCVSSFLSSTVPALKNSKPGTAFCNNNYTMACIAAINAVVFMHFMGTAYTQR